MEYRQLGATDLTVSRICFGTFAYSGMWGDVDEGKAIETIRRAFEVGINFFDTAQAYGFGLAESLLARALGDQIKHHRGDVVLATKGGLAPHESGGVVRDSRPKFLRQGLEESLKYLGTEHVDLYQIHWPDAGTPFEETAAAAEEFVQEGKARYIGVSNYDVGQMEVFAKIRRVDSLQPPYNLFAREIEAEILPYCQANSVGTLVYGPLAHGLLGGAFTPATVFPEDDFRTYLNPAFKGDVFHRNLQVVERLKDYGAKRGQSVSQLAIAWTLANPAVDVAIVGSRRPEYIGETAAAADLDLTSTEKAEIDALCEDAAPVPEPGPPER